MANNSKGRRQYTQLTIHLMGLLEHRRDLFAAKFGREHRRGEPLFFDADATEPRRLSNRDLIRELEKLR